MLLWQPSLTAYRQRPTLGLSTCDRARYTPTADRACSVQQEESGRWKTEPKELQRSGNGHARERSGAPKTYKGSYFGFSHKTASARRLVWFCETPVDVEFSDIEDFIHEPLRTYSRTVILREAGGFPDSSE